MPKELLKSKRLIPVIIAMIASAVVLFWGINYLSNQNIAEAVAQNEKELKKEKQDKENKAKKLKDDSLARTKLNQVTANQSNLSNNTKPAEPIAPKTPAERFALIHSMVEKYNNTTNQLKQEIERQKSEIDSIVNKNNLIQQDIEQDVTCLEQTTSKCDLKNESYLFEKGFPKDFGNPKYIKSLIEELKRYKIEIDSNTENAKKSIEQHEFEYNKRMTNQTELNSKFEQLNSDQTNEQLLSVLESFINGI